MTDVPEFKVPDFTETNETPKFLRIRPVEFIREAILASAELRPQDALPLFLGSLRTQHQAIMETALVFMRLKQLVQTAKAGDGVPEGAINSMEVKYKELVEKNFAGIPEKDLEECLTNYFIFTERGDKVLKQERYQDVIDASRFVNSVPHKTGQIGLIHPPKTNTVDKSDSVRNRMRRTLLKSTGSPDTFTIWLPNSRILLKAKVPTPWELASLINKITLSLNSQFFGGRIRVSSLHLERANISRIIVTWVLQRCTYWSVENILEAEELLTVIKTKDIDVIATAVLCIGAPKGVNYKLYCLANKCNYVKETVVDPAYLTHIDWVRYPEVYMNQMNAIFNEGKKFTIEELKESEVPFIGVDGKEIDDEIQCPGTNQILKISDPYLSDYFTCFDNAANTINKEIRELVMQFPNEKIFAEKRKELMSSMRMIDHIQYFSALITKADPLNGIEKDEVILRSEDPAEFDQGLMDMFNESDELFSEAIFQLVTKIPQMSYAFIGIPDDECPKCKKRMEGLEKEINKGFTPIDPILNFFDQAQMLIAARKLIGTTQEAILS